MRSERAHTSDGLRPWRPRHARWCAPLGTCNPGTVSVRARCAAVLLVALGVAFAVPATARDTVVLSGAVQALEAQAIYTPPSNSSPVVLRYYVPEGTEVEAGDALVRIDPGQSLTQIRALDAQIEQAAAKAEKEIAELAVKAVDAEVALVDAHATLEKARIDAAVPRAHVSALDYDRHQGELERATREHALKQGELAAAQAAVARRRADAALEVDKLEADRRYHEAQVANAEVRAERAGVVVHGFDNWRGGRFDEGSSSWPGNRVGEVVGGGPMGVTAWALEPDRGRLAEGQRVQLSFDALPGSRMEARIVRIAGAPDVKAEWGAGRYFELDIALPEDMGGLALKPGMSARVEVPVGAVVSEVAP